MKFTETQKNEMVGLLFKRYESSGFTAEGKFATTIDLSAADMSNLKNGKFEMLGDAKWAKIASFLKFGKEGQEGWQTANTYMFDFVTKQLAVCQSERLSAILIDKPGTGKTFAAEWYAANRQNVFYIDCSIYNRRAPFLLALAKSVGLGQVKVNEAFELVVQSLKNIESPLLIFDEGGDLDNGSILVIKSLYNALKNHSGMYIMGSDGLKRKINIGMNYCTVGYTELFSRFGKRFQSALPDDNPVETLKIIKEMAEDIALANGIEDAASIKKIQERLSQNGIGDLRQTEREIKKLQKNGLQN